MNTPGMVILLLILLLTLAAAAWLGWHWRRADRRADEQQLLRQNSDNAMQGEREQRQRLEEAMKQLQDTRLELEKQNAALSAQLEAVQSDQNALKAARDRDGQQQARIAELETALKNEQSNSGEKLQLLREAQEDMRLRFQKLAQEILEEKSRKFSADSTAQLTPLLDPLKQNIADFRDKIEKLHSESTKERVELKTHIEQMQANASQISADADNLAKALKGSGKTQGDWGEHVLEQLLEDSGLREGETYETQSSYTTEDGGRQRPDVVIRLPDNKHLIIDAKVSLTAYTDYNAAGSDSERQQALKAHLQSVKNHIEQLHEKNYSRLPALDSPDFVLLFMALEPAYILAMQEDRHLFTTAYNKKVVLTSPTTLMPILRTVANIWRIEKQQQEVAKVAAQGGRLYDKFVGFISDLDKVGKALDNAQHAYDGAKRKLSQGPGNLVRQAEVLRKMEITSSKRLPDNLVAQAEEGDEALPAEAALPSLSEEQAD